MKCFALLLLSASCAFGQMSLQDMQPFFKGASTTLAGPNSISLLGYWWVSSDLVTGATISNWTDRVSGIVATNGTANTANMPTNAALGLRFNGGQNLTNTPCPPTAQFGSETIASYFLIANSDRVASGTPGICSDFPTGRGIQLGATPPNKWEYGGIAASQTVMGLAQTNTPTDIIFVLANSSTVAYTNGVQTFSANQGTINHFDFQEFGHSGTFGFFKGYILEYAIYTNKNFSAGDIATLHNYAVSRYGVSP
jgi:hypothetical protein